MFDIKFFRKNLYYIISNLTDRSFFLNINYFNKLDFDIKILNKEIKRFQNLQNLYSKYNFFLKGVFKFKLLFINYKLIASFLSIKEFIFDNLKRNMKNFLLKIPNLLSSCNLKIKNKKSFVIKTWGEKKLFNFKPKKHYEILNLCNKSFINKKFIDNSGHGFNILYNLISRLHRSLIQFMMNLHVYEHGYTEFYVPYIVKGKNLYHTSQLPKFKKDLFKISNSDLWLIPTGEVPLVNLLNNCQLDINDLPLKFVCHTPCFRKEIGSWGKENKGIFRQHQFEKVELVQFVDPSKSYKQLEKLTLNAEEVLKRLNLPYRVVNILGNDLGFSSSKTYDIEVWLPGEFCYKEVSSCSNTESFQSYRMFTRINKRNKEKFDFVHILNGSGLAVGRTLMAIIENYQDESGNIYVPDVLISFMNGIKYIKFN